MRTRIGGPYSSKAGNNTGRGDGAVPEVKSQKCECLQLAAWHGRVLAREAKETPHYAEERRRRKPGKPKPKCLLFWELGGKGL